MVSTIANLMGAFVFRIAWVKLIVPDGSLDQVLACYPISWILISVFVVVYYLYRQPKIIRWMRQVKNDDKKAAA